MATSNSAAKLKRTVLTIKDKVKILKLVDTTSSTIIAERYGIGKSTISDIKRNTEKITKFEMEMTDMGMKKTAKTMKLGDDEKHYKAVYLWFRQKRMEGTPISGSILSEKAVQLYQKMYGDDNSSGSFSGSTGWQCSSLGPD